MLVDDVHPLSPPIEQDSAAPLSVKEAVRARRHREARTPPTARYSRAVRIVTAGVNASWGSSQTKMRLLPWSPQIARTIRNKRRTFGDAYLLPQDKYQLHLDRERHVRNGVSSLKLHATLRPLIRAFGLPAAIASAPIIALRPLLGGVLEVPSRSPTFWASFYQQAEHVGGFPSPRRQQLESRLLSRYQPDRKRAAVQAGHRIHRSLFCSRLQFRPNSRRSSSR